MYQDNLKELTDLISIRQYVGNAIGLSAVKKETIRELDGMLLLLDQKIIGLLTGAEFKNYIGYENVQQAKINAQQITNIYHGIEDRKKH
jgi:hypothetical protein